MLPKPLKGIPVWKPSGVPGKPFLQALNFQAPRHSMEHMIDEGSCLAIRGSATRTELLLLKLDCVLAGRLEVLSLQIGIKLYHKLKASVNAICTFAVQKFLQAWLRSC